MSPKMTDELNSLCTYFEETCLLHENEEVDIDTFIDIADDAIQRAKNLKAENERLTEALKFYANTCVSDYIKTNQGSCGGFEIETNSKKLQKIAKQALTNKEGYKT